MFNVARAFGLIALIGVIGFGGGTPMLVGGPCNADQCFGPCGPIDGFTAHCEQNGNNCDCVVSDCGENDENCEGACPGGQVCAGSSFVCECVDPILCGDAELPTCDGECSEGGTCTPNAAGDSCECVLFCNPSCEGQCPAGQFCFPGVDVPWCTCQTLCEEDFPVCGGACPTGEACQTNETADGCECIPAPCGYGMGACGGTCPPGEFCTIVTPPDVCSCVADCGCGNGDTQGFPCDEGCDDGNTDSCDGCSSTCEIESGLICGDGIPNEDCGEECDGGGESPDCDDDCTRSECGDGNLNESAGEECDDGNDTDGDGCAADCTAEEPVPAASYYGATILVLLLAITAAILVWRRRSAV